MAAPPNPAFFFALLLLLELFFFLAAACSWLLVLDNDEEEAILGARGNITKKDVVDDKMDSMPSTTASVDFMLPVYFQVLL